MLLQPRAGEHAGHGGQADERRVVQLDLAEHAEDEDAEEGGEADDGERGAGRLTRPVAGEEDEEGHDDDAAADTEERAEEAGRHPDADERPARLDRQRHVSNSTAVPGHALLQPLAAAPDRTALVFDVDGTLAPIVARPELAAVPAATRAELERLAARYLLVACLSGRAGADARALVGVEGIEYVGNHGLELEPRAEELAARIARFRADVGLPVEDKGLTLGYHFRAAGDEESARRELETVAERARAEGLDARWGRKVLEIRPSVAADKGTAVRALVERTGARQALYAGDDTTDLDAFAALGDLGLEHAVRIAVASAEAPPGLEEAADLVVAGPEELAGLLRAL